MNIGDRISADSNAAHTHKLLSDQIQATKELHRATKELHKIIAGLNTATKSFNQHASEQTQKMICLTRWVVGLTTVMFIGLVIQILIALSIL